MRQNYKMEARGFITLLIPTVCVCETFYRGRETGMRPFDYPSGGIKKKWTVFERQSVDGHCP